MEIQRANFLWCLSAVVSEDEASLTPQASGQDTERVATHMEESRVTLLMPTELDEQVASILAVRLA